jgi:hypothetical protein
MTSFPIENHAQLDGSRFEELVRQLVLQRVTRGGDYRDR